MYHFRKRAVNVEKENDRIIAAHVKRRNEDASYFSTRRRLERVRFVSMTPKDNALKVDGFRNLFCAGEKLGPIVGICEAIVTGVLVGYNAARTMFGVKPIVLPRTTCIGDLIAYVNELIRTQKVHLIILFAVDHFEIMKEKNLYTEDLRVIKKRVKETGQKRPVNTKVILLIREKV